MNCETKPAVIKVQKFKKMDVSPLMVKLQCAKHYNVRLEDILSSKRSRSNGIVPARHMAVHIMRTILLMDQRKIAQEINRKDHTTIINAVKRISGYLERYDEVRNDRQTILQSLNISE